MTLTILGTALASLAAALSMNIAGPADNSKSLAGTDVRYCVNPGDEVNYPDCVEPPDPSKDYRGVPIAVYDVKRVDPYQMRASMNVTNNDAIQRNSKKPFRIKIVGAQPERVGYRNWVQGNKIWFENLPGRNNGSLPSHADVLYRIVDFKGRASKPVYAQMVSRAKGCQAAGLC